MLLPKPISRKIQHIYLRQHRQFQVTTDWLLQDVTTQKMQQQQQMQQQSNAER